MDKKVLITEPTPFIEEELGILEKHATVRLAKGITEEALKRLKRSVAEEAIRILNGMPPKNLVNKDVCFSRKMIQ